MSYTLTFKDGVAEFRCTKDFDVDGVIGALREVVDAPWRSRMTCLLVVDEGSSFSPGREGIRQMMGLVDEILSNESVRIAIVVEKIVHYGIGRVLESRADHGSGRLRVFLMEDAARKWLGIA
jgi:hypothetical protein